MAARPDNRENLMSLADQLIWGMEEYSASVVPASGKIYDITHADTAEHSVALPAGYPANTKAIEVFVNRISGTGYIKLLSTTGSIYTEWTGGTNCVWYRSASGLFLYQLSVANDDFDIYAVGYIAG